MCSLLKGTASNSHADYLRPDEPLLIKQSAFNGKFYLNTQVQYYKLLRSLKIKEKFCKSLVGIPLFFNRSIFHQYQKDTNE